MRSEPLALPSAPPRPECKDRRRRSHTGFVLTISGGGGVTTQTEAARYLITAPVPFSW
jgi:hypothetical protein